MDLGWIGNFEPSSDSQTLSDHSQALHYIKSVEFVRWEHYNFRYNCANPWAFLGNGQVKAEFENDIERLTPYIRDADVPWHIES